MLDEQHVVKTLTGLSMGEITAIPKEDMGWFVPFMWRMGARASSPEYTALKFALEKISVSDNLVEGLFLNLHTPEISRLFDDLVAENFAEKRRRVARTIIGHQFRKRCAGWTVK